METIPEFPFPQDHQHLFETFPDIPARIEEKIFVSYSRVDQSFAQALQAKLVTNGFNLWRDRSSMEGGVNWQEQIYEAIRSSHTMILCLSPRALESPHVADEWRYARREGTRIIPVIASSLGQSPVPRWMKKLHWFDFLSEGISSDNHVTWRAFIQSLNTLTPHRPALFQVEPLPDNFVQRSSHFEALRSKLLDQHNTNPVGITTALHGGGGFGKTILAQALCHDEDIRNAYDDGILFIRLGQSPDILQLLNRQLRELNEHESLKDDLHMAALRFAALLEGKDMLVVLDDVWEYSHIKPFTYRKPSGNPEEPQVAYLITTRLTTVLSSADADSVHVDQMETSEAVQLLIKQIGMTPQNLDDLERLTKRLGEWALLVHIIGAELKFLITSQHMSLEEAIHYVETRLDRKGIDYYKNRSVTQEDRNYAILSSLETSARYLKQWEERFYELGIFPEDTDIPITTAQALWQYAGLDDIDTEDALKEMNALSLFVNFDGKSFRLHDVVREMIERKIIARQPTEGDLRDRRQLLGELVKGWGNPFNLPDQFAWGYYISYLSEFGAKDKAAELLVNLNWLEAKIAKTSVDGLLHDFNAVIDNPNLRLIRDAIYLSTPYLTRKNTLGSQLSQRLTGLNQPEVRTLLNSITGPRLASLHASLTPAGGAMLRIIMAHKTPILGVIAHNDQLFSCSSDKTLIQWDAITGKAIRTFKGHQDWVLCVLALDDHRLISGSADETIRLWDIETGKETKTLTGHEGLVLSLAVLDRQHFVSASSDGTLRIWDIENGECKRILQGHTGAVYGVARLDQQRIVSVSSDKSLRIWNWGTGACLQSIEAHQDEILSIAVLDDQHVVTASADKTLRIWETQTLACRQTLVGHEGEVFSVAVINPLKLVSVSADCTVRVWSLDTNTKTRIFKGHEDSVRGVAKIDNDHIVTCGQDQTLRIWQLTDTASVTAIEKHPTIVTAILNRDGKTVLSASGYLTTKSAIFEWDVFTGAIRKKIETDFAIQYLIPYGQDQLLLISPFLIRQCSLDFNEPPQSLNWLKTSLIQDVLLLDQRYLVIGEASGKITVWDITQRKKIHEYTGQTGSIILLAALDNHRFVSMAQDKQLRMWHLNDWQEEQSIEMETLLTKVVHIPDQPYVVVATDDYKIQVRDWISGQLIRIIGNHTNTITDMQMLGSQYLITCGKDASVHVWNIESAQLAASFNANNAFECLAVDNQGLITVGDVLGYVYFLRFQPE